MHAQSPQLGYNEPLVRRPAMLTFLDIFLLAFHTTLTMFNAVGWIWRSTRKLHLVTILFTAFSWFGLGFWFGWGYCFCTDWHWQVRAAMGRPVQTDSYIDFLILECTGLSLPAETIDLVTALVFSSALLLSVLLNWRDCRAGRI